VNRIVSLLAAATLLVAPTLSYGQAKAVDKPAKKAEKAAPATPAEPAAPVAKPEAAPSPEAAKPASASTSPPADKVASADKPKRGPSRANEDARACLEQPTNREVAICAEKFR
jgi:hypothetical protein